MAAKIVAVRVSPRILTWTTVNAWLLLLPAAVLLAAFTHYPIVATIYQSLFIARRNGPPLFAGADNYRALFGDPVFWQVLRNNLVFALGTVPTSIALALLMAVWVNGKLRGRGVLRLAYFTPTVLPMIAVANIWLFFYTPDYGLLDQIRGLLGFSGHNWLGDPSTVMGCMIVMVIWKEAGFFMIFYLAALQQMPPDLEEAAAVEGAGRWYVFRRVTFPLLMPTTLFVAINAVINSFKLVDHLVIMTKGGPNNASSLLLYYIYEVAFTFQDTFYAATLTVTLLVILIVAALLKFGYLDRRIHYQ
jgi:sn-glycerol 3-phosphate transport system permease protein